MTQAQHPVGYRIYLLTWLWLGILTLLAIGVSRAPMPQGLTALLLLVISSLKITLIAAFFMHLRFEKLNLVLITLTPLILAVVLWFFITPDTSNTARRILALLPGG